MKINEIMTPNPEWIGPDDTLAHAAATMRELNVGSLPVCKDGRLVGLLTDRDIAVRAVANGLDPQTSVRPVMSRLVAFCFDDQDQEVAASMMETNRIRRLPVLDHDEHLVGIISLGDLAVRSPQEKMALKVLERISADPPAERQAEAA
jgi:CBS domain-containing protein